MNHHAGQTGWPGTTGEIEESKFGKTKYNCSRYIKGEWVFERYLSRDQGLLSQTQVCTPSALKIHGGESNELCLIQENPKIYSKATHRIEYGLSTMEMIPLKTSSSTLPTYMEYAKMPLLFHIPLYALFMIRSPLHGGEKKIHSFITQDRIWGRKSFTLFSFTKLI